MSKAKNVFRILVASDVHLGYGEKDKIRGDDSFNAFEEVLQIAKDRRVDFVLLGGDLFHDNKPSQKCLLRCTELLRKYCYGKDPVNFKLVSDQRENFRHTELFPHVNFEDSHVDVSMPVFTIHGNHDDPIGKNPRCYLEVLSAAGLINYFGKYMDMDRIDLHPLLLTKGDTKLAIFGLGSLPEERLHRFFKNEKVNFVRPNQKPEDWFNLLVVHQNRVAHGTKYLPERFLPSFSNLVIWGHEHEAKELEYSESSEFFIFQPGSTVRTSLCGGEQPLKHVGLLEVVNVNGENKFKIERIPLKTVRQFLFETVNLDTALENQRGSSKDSHRILNWCKAKVQDMIDEAERDHEPPQPEKPLIRLRIESRNTLPFSVYQFGLHFTERVANPEDILLFRHRRGVMADEDDDNVDLERINALAEFKKENMISNIEDIVKEYFDEADEKSQLSMMDERAITLAVKGLVDKEDTDAIGDLLDKVLNKCREDLLDDTNESKLEDAEDRDYIKDLIKSMKDQTTDVEGDNDTTTQSESATQDESMVLSQASDMYKPLDSDDSMVVSDESADEEPAKKKPRRGSPRARGRGRGRGSTKSRR